MKVLMVSVEDPPEKVVSEMFIKLAETDQPLKVWCELDEETVVIFTIVPDMTLADLDNCYDEHILGLEVRV